MAADRIYEFIWEEYCDWYIEMVKPRLYSEDSADKAAALWTLQTVLMTALKLLHPYMPFVTEEIYTTLQPYAASEYPEESIMISAWPEYRPGWNFEDSEEEIELIKEAVRGIRIGRNNLNVPVSKKAAVFVVSASEHIRDIFEKGKVYFQTLAKATDVTIQSDMSGIKEDALSVPLAGVTIYIPLEELVDISKEIERLEGEVKRLTGEIDRCDRMLNNERFTAKAPQAKIDEEREKRAKYSDMMEQVKSQLAKLKGAD